MDQAGSAAEDASQRRSYYRPGLRTDRDAYDKAASYFLALLPTGDLSGVLLGSARVIRGESRAGFRFPAEQAFEFELPETIAAIAASQRVEVTRVVAEAVQGIAIGGLLTPLGLIQAISEYVRPLGIRCGLSVIKRRFLRVLQGLGVRLHEIQPARLVYPSNGPVAGYYYHHPDPVVPVYCLVDEIAPSVEQAISTHMSRDTPSSLARDLVTASRANTGPGSKELIRKATRGRPRRESGAARTSRPTGAGRPIDRDRSRACPSTHPLTSRRCLATLIASLIFARRRSPHCSERSSGCARRCGRR